MSNYNLLHQLGYQPSSRSVAKVETNRPVRAVTYIRVSTEDQADPVKGSLDNQLKKCMEAIERHSWKHVQDYRDVQKGHTIELREGMKKLLADASLKKFDVVVVYDADRFSRDKDIAAQARYRLKWNFIQVFSVNQPREPIDPDLYDPDQDDEGVIHDMITDFKSDVDGKGIRRKVRQGANKRALRGEPHDVPYGYGKNLKTTYPTVLFDIFQIEEEARVVRRIFNYYAKEDYSLRKICTTLNEEKIPSPMNRLWAPQTVRKILQNPFYIGIVRHNHRPVFRRKRKQTSPEEWILTPNDKIPKIVDEETFRQAQERIKRRFVLHGRAVASKGLCVGLAYCHCGHKLHYKRRNVSPSLRKHSPNAHDRWYYLCPCNRIHGNIKVCPCKIYKISAAKLDDIVVQRIHELASSDSIGESFNQLNLTRFTDNIELQIESAKKEKSQLQIAKMQWDTAYERQYINPEKYGQMLESVDARLKLVDQELSRLTAALLKARSDTSLFEKKRYYLSQFDKYFGNGDLAKQKRFLQEIIKRITVGNEGEVQIEFILDDVVPENYVHPHPCGYYGDSTKVCTCSSNQVLKYQKKLSGPLLDRIDIHIDVPAVKVEKLVEETVDAEDSATVRKRVVKALQTQRKRFVGKKIIMNSEMSSRDLKEFLVIEDDAKAVMKNAMKNLSLSARSFNKVLKVARTIADLASSKSIESEHIFEALQYRPRTIE